MQHKLDADVVVVGGGHNGLICAAYLARAGVDTMLIEARDAVGGCASTVSDLDARFNICNCDHSMVRAPQPTFLVNVPSLLDPHMQPNPDQHVLSLEVLFTPYALQGGWPESDEPARWLEVLDEMMEPSTLQLDRWRSMTPDRYEAEFSMHRGHTPSYAVPPLSAFFGLHRETTRYRTPISGLYLSGAGTFPGAGVFGAAGRNTADAVARDLRVTRRSLTAVRQTITPHLGHG